MLVCRNSVWTRAARWHRVLRMLSALREDMHRTASVRIICQMEILSRSVNVELCSTNRNVQWIRNVPADWRVSTISVSTHARNCCRVPDLPSVLYWIRFQCVPWFASVQNCTFRMRTANANESYCRLHRSVPAIRSVRTRKRVSIDSAGIRATAEIIQLVW